LDFPPYGNPESCNPHVALQNSHVSLKRIPSGFGFRSMSLKRTKRSVKLLSDHPFLAFSFVSSSTESTNVNLSSQPIVLSYKRTSLALFNPSKLSRPPLACS